MSKNLLLSLLLQLSILATAWGCTCGPITVDSATIVRAARGYDVVFIGEVVEQALWENEFRVIRRLKGLEETARVTTKAFNSCSTIYAKGYYLIYANWDGTALNTSYCSPTEAFPPTTFPEAQVRQAGSTDAFLQRGLEATHPQVALLARHFPPLGAKTKWAWYGLAGIGCLLLAGGWLFRGSEGLN